MVAQKSSLGLIFSVFTERRRAEGFLKHLPADLGASVQLAQFCRPQEGQPRYRGATALETHHYSRRRRPYVYATEYTSPVQHDGGDRQNRLVTFRRAPDPCFAPIFNLRFSAAEHLLHNCIIFLTEASI